MSIFAYYFQIIFLTNYVSGKIEGHVPPQSAAAKNQGSVLPRLPLPGAPMIKPPPQISKANFAQGCKCSEQQNQLFINIKQDTENNKPVGGVVARFCTLPDSDRWIEPLTLSDRTAVIFSLQFISLIVSKFKILSR